MSVPLCFVDTNVLVYSRDAAETVKQPRATSWREALWHARAGRLSAQVLNEYYITLTRKLVPALKRDEVRRQVLDLALWQPVPMSAQLLKRSWGIEDRFKISFWDSLIVAAAQTAGCLYLLTEDLAAGADFDGVTIVDPFVTAPDELLRS